MILKPNLEQIPYVKPLINIGCRMDIPTGEYLVGIHGEAILNGGLSLITGITGDGNTFKSTIAHSMMLTALDRITQGGVDTSLSTYDTEINIQPHALHRFTKRYKSFADRNILEDGTWIVTDKTLYYADQFYAKIKDFLKEKQKYKKETTRPSPFVDRDGNLMPMYIPTLMEIDSFTHFVSSAIIKQQEDNELGESGGLTIHMRAGLDKTRFLMEVPTILGKSGHYSLLTAHYGKTQNIQAGPMSIAPPKKLNTMKNGEVIKGATDQFYYVTQNLWKTLTAGQYTNQGTKGPEYPIDSDDTNKPNEDQYVVNLQCLRGKNGPSGFTQRIVISQKEGVLHEITDLEHIRQNAYYGTTGGNTNFVLDLYPDGKLSRTNARQKLGADPKLCRAVEITADIIQLRQQRLHSDVICTPQELYTDLKAMGYDWDELLETRGWWTVNNDQHPVPFLSTLDLFNIRKGKYKPYWKQ